MCNTGGVMGDATGLDDRRLYLALLERYWPLLSLRDASVLGEIGFPTGIGPMANIKESLSFS
jgi:hypothetical protein